MLEAFFFFSKKYTNDAIVAKLLRTPNRSATILELPYLCVNFPRPNSSPSLQVSLYSRPKHIPPP